MNRFSKMLLVVCVCLAATSATAQNKKEIPASRCDQQVHQSRRL